MLRRRFAAISRINCYYLFICIGRVSRPSFNKAPIILTPSFVTFKSVNQVHLLLGSTYAKSAPKITMEAVPAIPAEPVASYPNLLPGPFFLLLLLPAIPLLLFSLGARPPDASGLPFLTNDLWQTTALVTIAGAVILCVGLYPGMLSGVGEWVINGEYTLPVKDWTGRISETKQTRPSREIQAASHIVQVSTPRGQAQIQRQQRVWQESQPVAQPQPRLPGRAPATAPFQCNFPRSDRLLSQKIPEPNFRKRDGRYSPAVNWGRPLIMSPRQQPIILGELALWCILLSSPRGLRHQNIRICS
jgi:hypothetical protein